MLFESPRALLSWADEDLSELEESMYEFYATEPFEHFVEHDEKSGYNAQKVRITKPVPESWRKLVSHALADIRHSIDQSLFAACQALSDDPIEIDINFPWGTHPKDFEARMAQRAYIPEALYEALRRTHPYPSGKDYKGGDDTIYEARKLAGGNKHRVAIEPLPGVQDYAIEGGGRRIIILHEPWNRVKQEFTAVLLEPGSEDECKIKLNFGVAFGDVGPLERQPILGVLPYFREYAMFICGTLEQEVAKILGGGGDDPPASPPKWEWEG